MVKNLADEKNATLLSKSYALSNLCSANYAEICCNGDKVVGFLLANIKKSPAPKIDKSGNRHLVLDYIRGKYGKFHKRFRLLIAQMRAVAKTERVCKKFDAEILLFVVDGDSRGKGIGTSLINNFLATAKSYGTATVFLATDVLCNRIFYERMGFCKYSEFYDDCLTLLVGSPSNTDIYLMALQQ